MTNTLNNVPRELLERVASQPARGKADYELRALLSAPSPAGVDGLDERMKAAVVLSAAELIAGAPLDAFMKHAGVNDLETFGQWLETRRGECLRTQWRYALGERDKSDDMYEWTVAHSAVFGEAHVNFKAAMAGNQAIIDGLRGEVARVTGLWELELARTQKAENELAHAALAIDRQTQRIGKLAGLLRRSRRYVASATYSDSDSGDYVGRRRDGVLREIDAALSETGGGLDREVVI